MDFRKLRAAKPQSNVIQPIEIFRRLPKPVGINDLYVSQAQALETWFGRRNTKDTVIKLHTGGGKTLVGLLIAQSVLNEYHEPVIYLAATNQLVQQTLEKASEYGIPAISYKKGEEFHESFLAGKSVMVCSYQALFNGISRFGVRGDRDLLRPAAIILDDAHVAFSTVRSQFTLHIEREKYKEEYDYLTNLFRRDFQEMGVLGTFDDVIKGSEYNVLEVPYWSWSEKANAVREYLSERSKKFPYVWPFLRDNFAHCHTLISKSGFIITPILPLVDMIPAFAECPRRVFMSATIGDDSAIIRTFDANPDAVGQPIVPDSMAGISERMILVPELMELGKANVVDLLQRLAKWTAESRHAGVVILAPSKKLAEQWQDVATFASTPDTVMNSVQQLQSGTSHGPFVFANRYDGIDLPGQACRLLIFSGLPTGTSEYDLFRANVFQDGVAINSELAQRIEQGIGRGARGAGDHCVVILSGKGLVSWLSRPANVRFLTTSTRAQLEMGTFISRNVNDQATFRNAVMQCFDRVRDWMEYHAETLADWSTTADIDKTQLIIAGTERSAFRHIRDGYFEKAITKLERQCEQTPVLDPPMRGWLLQLAARAAHYWGHAEFSLQLQQRAYGANNYLLRPKVIQPYIPLTIPGKQAESIATQLDNYQARRGYLAAFDEVVTHLVPEASAAQFEEALAKLGTMIGFTTERPDKKYSKGPDVLWLMDARSALIIEAKSRKQASNAFTKDQNGQLLNASAWFKQEYPNYMGIPVSIHPNVQATSSVVTGETKALTLTKLNELVTAARRLLAELCNVKESGTQLEMRCEQLLGRSTLVPDALVKNYLESFSVSTK